jgi:hypothetical protein
MHDAWISVVRVPFLAACDGCHDGRQARGASLLATCMQIGACTLCDRSDRADDDGSSDRRPAIEEVVALARSPRRFKPRHRARVVFAEQSRAQQGSRCRCPSRRLPWHQRAGGSTDKGNEMRGRKQQSRGVARGGRDVSEAPGHAWPHWKEEERTYEMGDGDVCLFAVRVRTYVAVMASRSDGAIPVHVCHICEWLRPVGCSSW